MEHNPFNGNDSRRIRFERPDAIHTNKAPLYGIDLDPHYRINVFNGPGTEWGPFIHKTSGHRIKSERCS